VAAMVIVLPAMYTTTFGVLLVASGFATLVLRFVNGVWLQGVAQPGWGGADQHRPGVETKPTAGVPERRPDPGANDDRRRALKFFEVRDNLPAGCRRAAAVVRCPCAAATSLAQTVGVRGSKPWPWPARSASSSTPPPASPACVVRTVVGPSFGSTKIHEAVRSHHQACAQPPYSTDSSTCPAPQCVACRGPSPPRTRAHVAGAGQARRSRSDSADRASRAQHGPRRSSSGAATGRPRGVAGHRRGQRAGQHHDPLVEQALRQPRLHCLGGCRWLPRRVVRVGLAVRLPRVDREHPSSRHAHRSQRNRVCREQTRSAPVAVGDTRPAEPHRPQQARKVSGTLPHLSGYDVRPPVNRGVA
jgi:hypothetical protein